MNCQVPEPERSSFQLPSSALWTFSGYDENLVMRFNHAAQYLACEIVKFPLANKLIVKICVSSVIVGVTSKKAQ